MRRRSMMGAWLMWPLPVLASTALESPFEVETQPSLGTSSDLEPGSPSDTDGPSPFATTLVEVVGYPDTPGLSMKDDPRAVLGAPTTRYEDFTTNFPEVEVFSTSMVAPAFNRDLEGNAVVTTVATGQSITVAFNHPVEDDPRNLYGIDLIVFGNAFFSGRSTVRSDTDMDAFTITSPATLNDEPITVSVSPDGQEWYTYDDDDDPFGDSLFPTQAFDWDSDAGDWGRALDFTQPVNPELTEADFAGLTVSRAIELYEGSAGGTGFDLAESGFESIQYVRVTGSGGEIDAFADAAPFLFVSPTDCEDQPDHPDCPEPQSLAICVIMIGTWMGASARSRRGD